MRETGYYSVLEEAPSYTYTDGQKTGTIYAHVIEGLEFFLAQFSDRGLPLILEADQGDAQGWMGEPARNLSAALELRRVRAFQFPWLRSGKQEARLSAWQCRLRSPTYGSVSQWSRCTCLKVSFPDRMSATG